MTAPRWPGYAAALPMLAFLTLPVLALLLSASPSDLAAGVQHPSFAPALWLSAKTTVLSLGIVVVAGTPLAWLLAGSSSTVSRALSTIVDIPIVLPPAVVGIALLVAFGRTGFIAESLGLRLPFTTGAVLVAQVVVSAPFYIQGAAAAFRRVDPDLMIVARTLGQTSRGAFARVALPLALPGVISGAALAGARALGEFGATLLFAGNQVGVTQTMPLAIYTALESDVRGAVALALVLAAVSVALLLGLRAFGMTWVRGTA